jgi:Tol biopolymer transport system component
MPSDQAVPGLFCAPIDGSAASIRLNGSTRTAGFQLTPDGTRVVFITGFSSPRELFVVPIDGSSAPRRLHAPAANGRDVRWEFVVSPDSSQVVYVADHVVNERFELYVVPLDGSAPPRSLIPAPPPGQFIGNVRIDPSGQRAVYTLSASGPGHFASVLLDGSAPPVDLVPPSTVANVGALQAKQIFSNGWVVYTNSVPSGARRLYAVPVDGHAPAHLLSLPYESDRAGADSTFVIDGDRVFFTAGHTFEGYQLWVAAVDGSSGPVQVSPPGLEPLRYLYGSDPFAVVPGGELVVHLGAMTDGSNGFGLPVVGSTELFASSVGSVSGLPPRHGPAPRTVTPREIVR